MRPFPLTWNTWEGKTTKTKQWGSAGLFSRPGSVKSWVTNVKINTVAGLPRTQTSFSHGPLRFITSHSFRARLCHAKNEAPEEEAGSGGYTCLDATKFALLSIFTLIEAIYQKIWERPLPQIAKSPFPVDMRRWKRPYSLPSLPRLSLCNHLTQLSLLPRSQK